MLLLLRFLVTGLPSVPVAAEGAGGGGWDEIDAEGDALPSASCGSGMVSSVGRPLCDVTELGPGDFPLAARAGFLLRTTSSSGSMDPSRHVRPPPLPRSTSAVAEVPDTAFPFIFPFAGVARIMSSTPSISTGTFSFAAADCRRRFEGFDGTNGEDERETGGGEAEAERVEVDRVGRGEGDDKRAV